MPMPAHHYPTGWKDFSLWLRLARAKGQCECHGQCGLHQPNPKPRRCLEQQHTRARFANGTIRLTVAHLCTCSPICMNPAHVIAACQRCHLRIDRWKHAANRATTRQHAPGQTDTPHPDHSPHPSPRGRDYREGGICSTT